MLDAKTYPLQDILKLERRYVIPTFQRDYEWTEGNQWQLLFDDLATTADRLLEARDSGREGAPLRAAEQKVSPHFLGAIVCGTLPFSAGNVAQRSVIDGQQRLTTLQLLIRGLLDVLIEASSDRAPSVRRMLFNPNDIGSSPEEIYKLWPRRKDRDLWPTALADAIPPPAHGGHLYLQARRFFSSSVRGYASNDDGSVEPSRLVALADTVATLFKLVVIDLDDNDDAQVIFEVLNGRQTPLSAIDLVKNLLFLRSEFDEEDVEALYDRYWAQYDDVWWKEEVGRGHAQRGRRDVLLSVWLTAETGAEASVGHLYREARAYLASGPPTESVLKSLDRFAMAYRAIYAAVTSGDPALTAAYARIVALDITTAVPLLAWLRTVPEDVLPVDEHVRAVNAIESWALRRAYVGWQTRGYGAHFNRILREAALMAHKAEEQAEPGHLVADAVIEGLQSSVLKWPSDADMEQAFLTRKYYDSISQPRIRLLLGVIDHTLRTENPHEPAAVIEYDDLQIEHVMPQSWKDHWPVKDADGATVVAGDLTWEALSTARDQAVDRLGNLTLVTGTFNRAVSNLSWAVKVAEFVKQKSLVINYGVAGSETWDEATIDTRAKALAAVCNRIWPSPEMLGGVGAT